MHTRLASILACPRCRGELALTPGTLRCSGCESAFRVEAGVPLFVDGAVGKAHEDHRSNPLGAEFEAILKRGEEFVLNIGAGSTAQRYPNCIELEHQIFRHTDLVGDAHQLPFRDGVFDHVFAFNVFEHLRDPRCAAAEIWRVLRPGGRISIHTAFLQALHEAPHHFYNATEFGVREWFSAFAIDTCRVSGNFGPGVMLSYLLANVVEAARAGGAAEADIAALNNSTLGDWARFWADHSRQPAGFQLLQNLPNDAQSRVAAGFELLARKPQDA